ncbi:MAG: cell wall hydrolase [Lachnospiraceae bacterium]
MKTKLAGYITFCCLLSAVMIILCHTGRYGLHAQAQESQAVYTVPEVEAGMQVYLGKSTQPQEESVQDAFCRQVKMIEAEPAAKSVQVNTSEIHLNASDYECLLKIVESEAGICDRKGKILVANVVLNRMKSSSFPDTVTEVVYQKNQFSPVENGSIDQVTVSDETKQAVSMALSGTDYSQGALFFAARKLASEENMEWFDNSLKYLFEHDGHEFFTLK